VLVRWLAPVVMVFALVVHSATAFATAGVKNDVMCCCPSIELCKCHEHGKPQSPTHMNRCGGAVHEDAPLLVEITVPSTPTLVIANVVLTYAVAEVAPIPVSPTYVPEKPPF
jgi:hypothetical protein